MTTTGMKIGEVWALIINDCGEQSAEVPTPEVKKVSHAGCASVTLRNRPLRGANPTMNLNL